MVCAGMLTIFIAAKVLVYAFFVEELHVVVICCAQSQIRLKPKLAVFELLSSEDADMYTSQRN